MEYYEGEIAKINDENLRDKIETLKKDVLKGE